MAWVARLIDVAPDGGQQIITQGWLRASFRHVDPARSRDGSPYLTDDRDDPVGIGEDTLYRMDIWDTAHTLAPGHRLRLWLSSSDFPTHEPLTVAGRNLIFHDATHPSRLLLGTRAASRAIARPGDRTPPRISGLRLSRSRVRRGGAFTVRFRLSEAATVRVAVVRRLRGRRARTVTILRRRARAGSNVIRMRARRGRRALAAGRYSVVVRATDAAGNSSRPATRGLAVVR